jgi:hypothetical protein
MNSEFGLKRFVASHRSWEVTQGHRVTSHLTRLPLKAGPGVVGPVQNRSSSPPSITTPVRSDAPLQVGGSSPAVTQ